LLNPQTQEFSLPGLPANARAAAARERLTKVKTEPTNLQH